MAGIYIHIPFCKKLCFYCDFYHVITSGDNSAFVKTLIKEVSLRKEYLGSESVSTIYFGGGTPSVFSVSDLDAILKEIKQHFNVEEETELTIEMNPDDVNPQYLDGLRGLGV